MTTVTQPAPSAPDPQAEPATEPLKLPRRKPGTTFPGRPPVERRPDVPVSDDVLEALLSAATGVC